MDAHLLNQVNWDERAELHGQDSYYDIAGFLAGASSLREAELVLAGEVAGRDLLHLQCHIGLDTLSWARRGAVVTGLDFSGVAVRRARALADQACLPATFIQSDVRDLPAGLREGFDLVVATYGVFTWIDDLGAWARSAAATLRAGGRLVVVDIHPLAQMIDQIDPLIVDSPYADAGPQIVQTTTSYADATKRLENQHTVQWSHSVGEIVSAVAAAGLRIDVLEEHLSTDYNDRPSVLTQDCDGRWRLRVWDYDLPVLVSLAATRA